MKYVHYLWLIFPVSILVAGFMILMVNLKNESISQELNKRPVASTTIRRAPTPDREKALPYFLLGSAFILLILVLPRLQELSISEKSLVLKLISEVKEETSQLAEELPRGQETLKTTRSDDKLVRIRQKVELVEQLLKKGR
jgi:hypothetical protein